MSETVYAGQSTIQASLFRSVTTTSNLQTFTGPGQWIKPVFGTSVMIECWGAGGGGAASNVLSATSNTSGGGGGGGSYAANTFPINFFSTAPVAYVFVGVGGAGGTAFGAGGLGDQSNVSLANDSGSTAFIRGWGGNGGTAVLGVPISPAVGAGGAGAGLLGPGTYQNVAGGVLNSGGAATGPTNAIYSGAGGAGARSGASQARAGGAAIFGGAGGGNGNGFPIASNPLYIGTGGTSIYGGAGANGGLLNNGSLVAGSARGGGGGGGGIPSTNTFPNSLAGGAGGRGEVRIFVF